MLGHEAQHTARAQARRLTHAVIYMECSFFTTEIRGDGQGGRTKHCIGLPYPTTTSWESQPHLHIHISSFSLSSERLVID